MEISFLNFYTGAFMAIRLLSIKDYFWKVGKDVVNIKNDEGVAFYPFLWAKADSFESRAREIVPIAEIIRLEFDFLKQLYA